MIAVGFVVLNRVKKSWFPTRICEVIWEDWQFSWTKDEYEDIPENMDKFVTIWNLSSALLSKESAIVDPTRGSTHYYAITIPPPEWTKNLKFVTQIGAHKFYK